MEHPYLVVIACLDGCLQLGLDLLLPHQDEQRALGTWRQAAGMNMLANAAFQNASAD